LPRRDCPGLWRFPWVDVEILVVREIRVDGGSLVEVERSKRIWRRNEAGLHREAKSTTTVPATMQTRSHRSSVSKTSTNGSTFDPKARAPAAESIAILWNEPNVVAGSDPASEPNITVRKSETPTNRFSIREFEKVGDPILSNPTHRGGPPAPATSTGRDWGAWHTGQYTATFDISVLQLGHRFPRASDPESSSIGGGGGGGGGGGMARKPGAVVSGVLGGYSSVGLSGSDWGTVHPHTGQKSAPAGAIAPQCAHVLTAGQTICPI